MTTTRTPRSAAMSPAPEVHDYPFTLRSDGDVLALFTGSRADQAVAARAADHATRTGHPVTTAAVVRSTGFSINALLHLARGRRIRTEADAVLVALLPVIARAGPGPDRHPGRASPHQPLPGPARRPGRTARRPHRRRRRPQPRAPERIHLTQHPGAEPHHPPALQEPHRGGRPLTPAHSPRRPRPTGRGLPCSRSISAPTSVRLIDADGPRTTRLCRSR